MNDRLEQYLRQATRGLWGRRRAEVREELEGHIQGRVERHQVGGMGYEEALERSIAELGAAGNVSRGMFRLYVAPLLAGSSLLMAMLVTAVVLFVSSSVAQVDVTRTSPVPGCGGLDCSTVGESSKTWVNLTQLGAELRRQGIGVEQSVDTFRLRLSGGQVIDLSGAVQMKTRNGFVVSFERDGKSYLLLGALLSELAQLSQDGIKIRGLKNPTLEIGGARFSLEDKQTPVEVKWDLADATLRKLSPTLLPASETRRLISTNMWSSGGVSSYNLEVQGSPGTLYVVATRTPVPCGGQEYTCLGTDIAEVGADGRITFSNFGPRLEFTDNPRDLYTPSIGVPHKALLLRLTGQLDRDGMGYTIELPQNKLLSTDPAR